MKEISYKNFDISIGSDGLFCCYELELEKAETYREICNKIDAHLRSEKEAVEKIPVIILDDDETVREGTTGAKATSSYGNRPQLWVSWKQKSRLGKMREKEELYRLYRDTPENRDIFEKIIALEKQRVALSNEQDTLRNKAVSLAGEKP